MPQLSQQKLESLPLYIPGEMFVREESNSQLTDPMGRVFYGTLVLTNYRLLFWSSLYPACAGKSQFYENKTNADEMKNVELDLPIGFIQEFDRPEGNLLNIKCKDFRNLSIRIKSSDSSNDRFDKVLERFMNPRSYGNRVFAYLHYEALKTKNTGYNSSVLSSEFQRQLIEMNNWRITKVNHNFEVCETYPDEVAVPKDMTDEQITTACQFRTKNRFPVLCWIHQDSKATLTRSSQPATGLTWKRNESDEKFLRSIKEANAYNSFLTIIDARPMINARANMARGGGIESQSIYTSISYDFLNIPNIHVMRESQRKLADLIDHPMNPKTPENCGPDYSTVNTNQDLTTGNSDSHNHPSTIAGNNTIWWHKALEETKWLHYIRQILLGALTVAEKINSQRSVFVHCSDGWDRTAQIVALPQLMLDPYYRTIKGFQTLVDKEWLLMGHKISQRTGGLSEESSSGSSNLFNTMSNITGGGNSNVANNNCGSTNSAVDSAVNQTGVSGGTTGGNSQSSNGVENNAGNTSPTATAQNGSAIGFGLNNPMTNVVGSSSPKSERAPIFLQFVDCVWQMTQQFVAAFEFNEQLLIDLMDAVYSGLYGDFLFNSDLQRRTHDVYTKTLSFWSRVNSDPDRYRNPLYTSPDESGHRVLFPQYRLPCIKLWTGYYLRHYLPSRKQDPELEYSRILSQRMRLFKTQLNRVENSSNNNSDSEDQQQSGATNASTNNNKSTSNSLSVRSTITNSKKSSNTTTSNTNSGDSSTSSKQVSGTFRESRQI